MKLDIKNNTVEGSVDEILSFVEKQQKENRKQIKETKKVIKNINLKAVSLKKRKHHKNIHSYKRWTNNEIKIVDRLKKEGKTNKQIGRKLCRSESAIKNLVRIKKLRQDNNKKNISKINISNSKCNRWTYFETTSLKRMYKDDLPLNMIARRLEKTQKAIENKIYRLKIKKEL